MSLSIRRVFLILISAVVVSSCGGPTMITDESVGRSNPVIAKGDRGYQLHVRDYYTELKQSWYVTKGGIIDRATALQFRDSLIMDTLAGFEADSINLRNYPAYYIDFREQRMSYLTDRFWKQTVMDIVAADSQEVVDFYFSRPDLFALPDYVNVRHIFVSVDGLKNGKDSLVNRTKSNETLEEMSKALIYEVRGKIDAGMSFDSAALIYSADQATARVGGHLGWIPKGQFLHPFDSVAFGMKNSDISQPYRDKDGWHILHVERRVEEGMQPYDSLWYRIARKNLLQLRANTRADSIKDTLYSNIDVTMNPDILDTNINLVEDMQWCAVVDSKDTILAYEMKKAEDTWRKARSVKNTTAAIKHDMAKEIARRYRVQNSIRMLGIDTLETSKTVIREIHHGIAKTIALGLQHTTEVIPSDSAVDAYYREHQEQFVPEKPLVVQHIVSTDSAQAAFIRVQALSGVDFMELARKYYPGDENLREELANLGEIGPKDVDSIFYQQALLTRVGSVSEPVHSKFGWHIIKVLKRVDETPIGNARYKILGILIEQGKTQYAESYKAMMFKKYCIAFTYALDRVHLAPYNDRLKTIQ